MNNPITLSRFIRALAACLAVALLGARAAGGDGGIEYEVVDGAVLVFGYRLETLNPLPEVGDCEGCGEIGFHPSPDGRWILIVSDVRFTDNDIWLYDTTTRARPTRVVDARGGRHLATGWLSERVFEVRWSGMGYSSSLRRGPLGRRRGAGSSGDMAREIAAGGRCRAGNGRRRCPT